MFAALEHLYDIKFEVRMQLIPGRRCKFEARGAQGSGMGEERISFRASVVLSLRGRKLSILGVYLYDSVGKASGDDIEDVAWNVDVAPLQNSQIPHSSKQCSYHAKSLRISVVRSEYTQYSYVLR
jgi:hypothetical protein